MKLALLSLLLVVPVMAQESVEVDTSTVVVTTATVVEAPATSSGPTATDGKLLSAWNWATDNGSSLHFLDNGTAATLYDFNRKEWLAGAMTALYNPEMTFRATKIKPLSLDVGVIKSMEAGQAAFPFGAVRFHGREVVGAISSGAKDFFEARQNLLKYLTCGGWVARDWNIGEYRYGGFIGAETKF